MASFWEIPYKISRNTKLKILQKFREIRETKFFAATLTDGLSHGGIYGAAQGGEND